MSAIGGPKRQEIRSALLAAFPNRDAIVELLTALDKRFESFEVTGSALPANVLAVVNAADDFNWLADLLAKAAEIVPGDTDLARLRDEIKPLVPSVGVDPFLVCRLSGTYLMLNRTDLRTSLRGLSTPNGNRILVVKGEPKTGKTHTAQFISFIADARQQFTFVPIDLAAFTRLLGPGVPVEPNEIAKRLVGKLGYPLTVKDPPATGPWANWILDFCDEFENHAANDPQPRWVVIDAFNSVVATQNTLDLIKELSIRVNLTLRRFRLILLGFTTELPPDVSGHLDTEQIKPISAKEVVEFFATVYVEKQLPIVADDLAALAYDVLEGLDTEDPEFLPTLMTRVSEKLP